MTAEDREAKMAYYGITDSSDALIAYKLFEVEFLFRNVGKTTAKQVTAKTPVIEIYSGRPDQHRCDRMTSFDWIYGGAKDVPAGAPWAYKAAIEVPLRVVPGIDPRVRMNLTVEYGTETVQGVETRTLTICSEAVRSVLGTLHWFECSRTPLPEACNQIDQERGAHPNPQPAPVPN